MKKSDKINLIHTVIGTYRLCRCYFKYDSNCRDFYMFDNSDKLFLGIREGDMLNEFQMRKISDLNKIEIKNDPCTKTNKEINFLADIRKPDIDISSWKTVFESLKKIDTLIGVKIEKLDGGSIFYMGYIAEIRKTYVIFSHVDNEGELYDNIEIPFSEVTSVSFIDKDSKIWQQYLKLPLTRLTYNYRKQKI